MDGICVVVIGFFGIIYLACFDEGDVVDISVMFFFNWIFFFVDYQYVIGGQFYFSVIDFEMVEIVGFSQGIFI